MCWLLQFTISFRFIQSTIGIVLKGTKRIITFWLTQYIPQHPKTTAYKNTDSAESNSRTFKPHQPNPSSPRTLEKRRNKISRSSPKYYKNVYPCIYSPTIEKSKFNFTGSPSPMIVQNLPDLPARPVTDISFAEQPSSVRGIPQRWTRQTSKSRMIDKEKYSRQEGGERGSPFRGYYVKWPRWAPADRGVTAWEVVDEKGRRRSIELPPSSAPVGKGDSPRKKNNRVKFLRFSRANNSARERNGVPWMTYSRSVPIWDGLLCSLHSGMHNRELFVMRDSDRLEALIGLCFFPLGRSRFWNPGKKFNDAAFREDGWNCGQPEERGEA